MSEAGEGQKLRLFVACEPPAEVLEAIRDWQRRALAGREGVRLNAALHITLCFLGSLEEARVETLEEALAGVRFSAPRLSASEALFLPQRGAKRVVALRVEDPSGGLASLQSAVSARLAATRLYEAERRAYHPHITVARYRRPGQPFSLQNVNIPEFGVDRFSLYSSLLERAGAVHTPLADFPAS